MRLIDLSHPVVTGMPQRFKGPIPSVFDHRWRKGREYEAVDDCSVLQHHLGTHVDAPRHYDPHLGSGIDEIPLERLISPAVVLHLENKEPRSEITPVDLDAASARAGAAIRPRDGVLLNTGMAEKYHTWDYDTGWEQSEYAQHPSLNEEAVRWLLGKQVSILGVDMLSPDHGEDSRPTHQILLRDNGIPIVENLCNFDSLSETRVLFAAAPAKIVGASGFPVRAVAIEGLNP